MNLVKQIIALATLAAAGGAALAESPTAVDSDRFVSGKSRAEVRAETLQAIWDGSITLGGELALMSQPAMATMSTLSRAEVRAQLTAMPLAGGWKVTETP